MKKEKEVIIKNVEIHYTDTVYNGEGDGLPKGISVIYRQQYNKYKKDYCYYPENIILITCELGILYTMCPGVCPYLKIEKGIICCISDCKLELFNTKTYRYTTMNLPVTSLGYKKSIEVDDNYITISGIKHGLEGNDDEIKFEIELTRENLICVKN